jgi:hypothetical protein
MSVGVEYLVADAHITVGLSRRGSGTGRNLRPGDRIPASQVARGYIEGVRSGKYAKRAHLEIVGGADPTQEDDSGGGGDLYDPSKHKVDEVLAYLAGADAAEVERVKELETHSKLPGRPSKRIAEFEAKGE